MKQEQDLELLEKVAGGYNTDEDWEPRYGLDSQPCGRCHEGTVYHTQQSFGPFERYYCNKCGGTWDF